MGRIKFLIKYYLARILLYIFVLPKRGYGAEIGVRKGGNAKLLYYITRPDEMLLVDSYLENDLYTQEQIERMYNKVLKWTEGKYIILERETSEEASSWIYAGGLDWVYIDANHSDLYNDLDYWYNNIKKGGVIMGDDYGGGYIKIKEDADRFCKERGLKLHHLHYQFWFRV